MRLSTFQQNRFQDYKKRNKWIFSNEIVSSFFQSEDNIALFLKAIDGEKGCQQHLNENFQKHFFRIRFIKYMVSIINYCSIDQIRKVYKNSKRNLLSFDQPTSNEGNSMTYGELLLGKQAIYPNSFIEYHSPNFIDSIKDERLELAFSRLSAKQQVIITYRYIWGYKDLEISRMLGVTQQAVSKARNLALQKLRISILERE